MEIDASILDVSTELISETPQKKPTLSPKSTSQDIIKRLGIVTGEGRVDATTSNSLNTAAKHSSVCYFVTWHTVNKRRHGS